MVSWHFLQVADPAKAGPRGSASVVTLLTHFDKNAMIAHNEKRSNKAFLFCFIDEPL